MKAVIFNECDSKGSMEENEVFGFYLLGGKLYLLLSPRNYGGLLAFEQSDVKITDPVVGPDMELTYLGGDQVVFLNSYIAKNKLYHRLIECEPNAYELFYKFVKNTS